MIRLGMFLQTAVLILLVAACGGGDGDATGDMVDTTSPVITLVGDDPQVIKVYGTYVEQGATATDNVDGELTSSIIIDASQVNTSLLGSYSVSYSVTDSSGNPVAATRTVDVVDTTTDPVTGMEFVYVPPGTFIMGDEWGWVGWGDDEIPTHRVTISKGFYMGKYEVSQAQWYAMMGTNPSFFSGSNLPVEMVNWRNAQLFIAALNTANENDGCVRGDPGCYYLPTEAQWEYAAKGGPEGTATFTQYAGSDDLDSVAWHWLNCNETTHPVGTKAPNELGLYDMSGNVWEWVQDWYGSYTADEVIDPTGPATGGEWEQRVERGGSWADKVINLRVSDRYRDGPGYPSYYAGFRLARE